MKKIDLGQTLGILANVGVIAGIVFLGYELQQNNEFLASAARATRHELRSVDSNRVFFENPALAELLVKMQKGDALSESELYVSERRYEQGLLDLQFVFVEYQRGLLEEADIPRAGWRAWFYSFPAMPAYWEANKNQEYRSDFVEWFDANIVK